MKEPTPEQIDSLQKKRRERYIKQSEGTSKIMRQLVIGGVAFVWLLLSKGEEFQSIGIGKDDYGVLKVVLFLMCLALMFDLLHRLVSVVIYQYFARDSKLTKLNHKGDRVIRDITPKNMAIPWVLFYSKIIIAVAAYIILGIIILR